MHRRWAYAGAALLLAVSFIGLRASTYRVAHFPVELRGGVPALVYEPGPLRLFGQGADPSRRFPVVVLGHGFASNRGMMSHLARYLARSGYAVVALDFRGHGDNPRPLPPSSGGSSGLIEDLDAAVLYARTQPHYLSERVAVAGHSMGGFAALEYASRNPGVTAVVGISAGAVPGGPYAPPNVLLIWASRDPASLRSGARAAGAHFANLDRLVLDRTYGDPERGSAVRLSEVEGTDHIGIVLSSEAARRIVEWLEKTLGPGAELASSTRDWRGAFSLLALVAYLVLFWGLARVLRPLLPQVALPAVERPLVALGRLALALAAAALLLAGFDGFGSPGPFAFVPLAAGRDYLGFLVLTGLLLLVDAARRGERWTDGLGALRSWIGAGLLLGFSYVVFGALTQPYLNLWIAPHRFAWAIAGALLALPFFGATEWLLRGPERSGVWAPALGKLVTLAVIGVGAASGVLPFVLLLALGAFSIFFVVFELTCYRLSRTTPNPWLAALFQAGWTGWAVGVVFPYSG